MRLRKATEIKDHVATAASAVPRRRSRAEWLTKSPRSELNTNRYAVPAFVNASIASDNVGNINKICSTFVISNTFRTRLFTPVIAMRRPALAHEVQALTSDPSPEESR